ncbi:hypothetical protein N431DRAFT_522491 [Stipitochalara longipes BDJ]|nr:hypothetical protein N431DRAFT_522491 [Stipitochalara longipes BDJ]
MHIKDLQKQLEEAESTLELLQARRDSELSRMRREIRAGEEYFDRMVTKDKKEIERIEKELNAKVSEERASWKEWPQAELIRRWEIGDFNYEHFKDTENALILRHAYKACVPDAEPRSVSRIMRVSAQVAAGWYKTPLEAPHCNPPREMAEIVSPKATPVKAAAVRRTPVKATPAEVPTKKTTPAKVAPAKTASMKIISAKKTPAKISKPKTAPIKETTVADGSQTVKSPAQKVQAKNTPVKKSSAKGNTAEPSKIVAPAPVCGMKRAYDATAVAGETSKEDSQQQPADKKVKIGMQQ